MKSDVLAAVAASVLVQSSSLVTAAPANGLPYEVAVLGGSTMRLTQTYNQNFNMRARGPRELAKAYHKFGVAYPDNLRQALERIVAELGLTLPNAGAGNGVQGGNSAQADGNDTADAGQGR